jgi:hypothetical protein
MYSFMAEIEGKLPVSEEGLALKAGSKMLWSPENPERLEFWIVVDAAANTRLDLYEIADQFEDDPEASVFASSVHEGEIGYRIVVSAETWSIESQSVCLLLNMSDSIDIGFFSVFSGAVYDIDENVLSAYTGAGLSSPELPDLPWGVTASGKIMMVMQNEIPL